LLISFFIASIHCDLSGPVNASAIVRGSPGSDVIAEYTCAAVCISLFPFVWL
jgi:hypothetical protein